MSVVSNNTLHSITSIFVEKSYIADLFTKLIRSKHSHFLSIILYKTQAILDFQIPIDLHILPKYNTNIKKGH